MADAITVLGSRHGLFLDPLRRKVSLVRCTRFESQPDFGLRAGLRWGGRTWLLPLAPARSGEQDFRFLDQRMTPCTFTLIGLIAELALKVRLTVVTPFRPRDGDFSTVPVLGLELRVEPLGDAFRWEKVTERPEQVELFLGLEGFPGPTEETGADALDLAFTLPAGRQTAGGAETARFETPQRDRLLALEGGRVEGEFRREVTVAGGDAARLRVAWATWSEPLLVVRGEGCPFRYAHRWPDLDAVAGWARSHGAELWINAARVDGIVGRNNVSAAVNHLLAQTLHAWLACTWWVRRPDGRDWFSVWEGSCYFHSTVDVEFTQAPFYLAVWPELLALELDQWPEFAKPGEPVVGAERGKGSLFLSHDCGVECSADGQAYPHEMEVEETANYILLAFAHQRRTGRREIVQRHAATIEAFLRFLLASDTNGNGVPDVGVANTIDDASPAVQFGREQTYLAVKTLAALETGALLLEQAGRVEVARQCVAQAEILRATFESRAWVRGHFAVLLEKSGQLKDPWTGQEQAWKRIPGWDAPHIYTANTLPLLDMVGYDLRLNPTRVKKDLRVATARCLREYGCVHTDFTAADRAALLAEAPHFAGAHRNPGWVSMNLLRDLAALYRGVDHRHLPERYWAWQVLTNTQEAKLFFETFGGNNLNFYPRGVVVWGWFDALAGQVVHADEGPPRSEPKLRQFTVPLLLGARWTAGECEVVEA